MMLLPALATLAFAPAGAQAERVPPPAGPVLVQLTLKDHRFSPEKVSVPANRSVRIELANQDPASEEFDSEDLRVEKDVTPHGKISFLVGPLKPGTYSFMGELHADTASGEIVATPAD
jgi:heme/copper-type cytochrome/quinol oxidase subunit 2